MKRRHYTRDEIIGDLTCSAATLLVYMPARESVGLSVGNLMFRTLWSASTIRGSLRRLLAAGLVIRGCIVNGEQMWHTTRAGVVRRATFIRHLPNRLRHLAAAPGVAPGPARPAKRRPPLARCAGFAALSVPQEAPHV